MAEQRFGPRLRLRQNDGSQPSDDQVLPFANRAERDSSLDLRTRRVLQREVPSTSRHPSRHIRSFQRLVVVVVVVSHRFQTSRSSASSNDLTSRRQLERLSQFAFLPSQKLVSISSSLPESTASRTKPDASSFHSFNPPYQQPFPSFGFFPPNTGYQQLNTSMVDPMGTGFAPMMPSPQDFAQLVAFYGRENVER